MLKFLGQLVHVLAALVEFAEPHNFIVSDLDCARLGLELFFEPEVRLDELIVLVA